MELVHKQKYSLNDLLDLVNILRSPEGCPWDRAQTHSSIRSNLIEKAYDAAEAIDLSDSDMLKEELGDILFQIIFHCSMEEDIGNFDFDDVVNEVCKKIIMRHPHVFSQYSCFNSQPTKIYEIRPKENHFDDFRVKIHEDTPAESVKNVSKILPALMRSMKIQDRAAKAGYGLFSVEDAVNEAFERLHYLETLIIEGRQDIYAKELGDLLFSITEVARLIGVDAESALYDSCEKFKNEFLYKILLENRNKM
ncbi:MAG: MazG family protein [Clostridia bacterium]|nr:MazG family protein [Clostridia bacterium]